MSTLKNQVLEAILTHPKDTIMIKDIVAQLDENVNIATIRVIVARDLKNEGYVKRTDFKGKFGVYKILKRDRETTAAVKVKKKEEISLEDIGKAIVDRIRQLENKIVEISQAYSDLQTEYRKEVDANKVVTKRHLKEIEELKEVIRVHADRLKAKERTFNISELTGQ